MLSWQSGEDHGLPALQPAPEHLLVLLGLLLPGTRLLRLGLRRQRKQVDITGNWPAVSGEGAGRKTCTTFVCVSPVLCLWQLHPLLLLGCQDANHHRRAAGAPQPLRDRFSAAQLLHRRLCLLSDDRSGGFSLHTFSGLGKLLPSFLICCIPWFLWKCQFPS